MRTINKYSFLLTLMLSSLIATQGNAQAIKINNGENELSVGGLLSSYYNYREYPKGVTPNLSKNTIKLKDAKFELKGKYGKDYEFHFQIDVSAWGATLDPANPLLDDANFTYKGFRKLFNINIGYGKVPYSFNSLVEHEQTPYWERPQITKGDVFSRRDAGITLDRSFWNKRIKATAGVYTGVGEVVLGGTNDASGGFEYIGRLEVSYPEKRHDEVIDTKISSKPNFSIGLNGRYASKKLPAGSSFLSGETGALLNDTTLNFKVVNGEKYILGMDVNVEYKGASVQFETHSLTGRPQNETDPLFVGLPKKITNNYFKAGGWFAQANYFILPIKTILSVRYDEINVNDLIPGNAKHLGVGICWQLKGFASMLKAEFKRNLDQTETVNASSYGNEYRIGWQFIL